MAATAEGCALELPSTCADARFPVQNARQIPSLASNRAEPVFSGQTLPPPRHQGRWREHLRTSKRQHVRVAACQRPPLSGYLSTQ